MRTLVLYTTIGVAFVILCTLGSWQLQRLHWKEALISETQERLSLPALSVDELVEVWQTDGDVNFRPVSLEGSYLHDKEMYYYNTHKGTVGWNVFTPFQLSDGRFALVNRGFVPDQKKLPTSRPGGQLTGDVQVSGLARNPIK